MSTSSQKNSRKFSNGVIGTGNRYLLGRALNEGSFGRVQHAYDTQKRQDVAIKYIQRGSKVTEYVIREIINHRTLYHPHIISFEEVFLTQDHLCIVMEYAAGGDMHDYITRHRSLPEPWARWFFQQLIIAMQYCHKRNVCIRDIKLENILLDKNHQLIKLCDFGFSKHTSNDSLPETCVGTPSYLAPEVLKHPLQKKPYDGAKVDIWTCGVCLFVMVFGHYPFDDPYDTSKDKTKKMLKRISQGKVEIPKQQTRPSNGTYVKLDVSEPCRDLLSKLLQSNPAKRASTMDIMKHPWFKVGLPEGTLNYNDGVEKILDTTIEKKRGLQSEEVVRQILEEAKKIVSSKTENDLKSQK